MSEEMKAAKLQARAACAMIEAMGMVAQNEVCTWAGQGVQFCRPDFMRVLEKYDLDDEAVIRGRAV